MTMTSDNREITCLACLVLREKLKGTWTNRVNGVTHGTWSNGTDIFALCALQWRT